MGHQLTSSKKYGHQIPVISEKTFVAIIIEIPLSRKVTNIRIYSSC